jgi:CBS domain-containing protein
LKVKDVMVRPVITVKPGTSAREAAQVMVQHQIGSIIIAEGDKPLGIATERDFMERLLAAGKDPDKTAVDEIMTSKLVDISPEASVFDAIRLMRAHRYSQLPVTQDGKLVGIVGLADLMHVLATFIMAERIL